MAKLQKLVKDLDGRQSKVTESNEQTKKIQGLRDNLECAMNWCRALDQHVQDFFLFSAHIAENWNERRVEDLNLAKVASDLCDCVNYAMGMIRPDKARPIPGFKQPTWLTERRARNSLELAECELGIIDFINIGND